MEKAMSILATLVPSRFLYYTDIIKSKEGTLMTKQEISEIKKLIHPEKLLHHKNLRMLRGWREE